MLLPHCQEGKMSVKTGQPAELLWHETATPGVFQRSMTANEAVFNPSQGFSMWSSVKLKPINESTETIIDLVRRAWVRILYEQPQLAATFDYGTGTATYTTITETSLDSWLQETFIVTQAEETYKCAVPRDKPILCVNPNTREMLFRTPHSYLDGMGTVLLWSDLISHIANATPSPMFGDKIHSLAPVFEVAAAVPATQPADLELGKKMMTDFIFGPPSIGLPFRPGPSASHSISEIRLSVEDSDKIVKACRKRGITVTHAVHAALILATAECSTLPGTERYTSMQYHNWRSRLQSQFRSSHVALYTGMFPMCIPLPSGASTPFSSLAQDMKHIYTSTNASEEVVRAHAPWWQSLADLLAAAAAAGEAPEPVTVTPNLSNLGVIEKTLPREVAERVEDFRLGLDMDVPFLTVLLWSWKGRISACASWNHGSFGEGEVSEFLGGVVKRLGEGLGVELSDFESRI